MQAAQLNRNDDEQSGMHDASHQYSANITAACEAASLASTRLYCTSKQEKLERRRMSNRRSALRRRFQEQADMESLENQIRSLAETNCHLRAEELRLQQLLQYAHKCIRGKRHFHKTSLPDNSSQGDCKLPCSSTGKPSVSADCISGDATTAASSLFSPFPIKSTAFAQRTDVSKPESDAACDYLVSPFFFIDKREVDVGGHSEFASSFARLSGAGGVAAALSNVINQNEAKMYGLVNPTTIKNTEPFQLQDQQSQHLAPGGYNAVWNILLTRAAQGKGFPCSLNNSTLVAQSIQQIPSTATVSHFQKRSSTAYQENPNKILSLQSRDFGCNDAKSEFQTVGSLTAEQILAQEDEESSTHSEHWFTFDQKVASCACRPPQQECAFSDQSSSCSADLDRFLALDEQID